MPFIPTEEHMQAPSSWINEPGTYNLKVEDCEKIISSSGTPGYKFKFRCIETNKTMEERIWETEKSYWRICLFAKSCSVQIPKGSPLDIKKECAGKTFRAEVGLSEPSEQGKRFAEIATFLPGKFESLWLPEGAKDSKDPW